MIFTNTLPHNRDHQSVTFSSARWALIYNPPLFAASSPFPFAHKNPASINSREGRQELRKPITQTVLEMSCIWIQTLQTLSSLLCQLSSLFTMRSIQWDNVAKIPAVVALNVIASPLKSMPLIPLGVRDWSAAQKRRMLIKTNAPCAEKNNVLYYIHTSGYPSQNDSYIIQHCCQLFI